MTPSTPILVLDAITTGRSAEAEALVFEYMAATQAEVGRPLPTDVAELPEVLRTECDNIGSAYRAPGTMLLAYRGRHPIGCVASNP
jgi:hypothetical protein